MLEDQRQGRTGLGVRVAADLEEVGRTVTPLRYYINGRHGEARSIGQHPSAPVEFYQLETCLAGGPFELGNRFFRSHGRDPGLACGGCRIHANLQSKATTRPSWVTASGSISISSAS